MSEELPVITSIDELPDSAIEELTDGNDIEVVEKKSANKASASPKKGEEVAEPAVDTAKETTDDVVDAEVKPKRKRRTKAEIEASKSVEADVDAK